jgi:hypothetical protein
MTYKQMKKFTLQQQFFCLSHKRAWKVVFTLSSPTESVSDKNSNCLWLKNLTPILNVNLHVHKIILC